MTITEFLEGNNLKYEALLDLFEQMEDENHNDDYIMKIEYEN